jgi:hypothetical protein
MLLFDRSGFYQDENGLSFLVTQGLAGNTLIAGKQCLFRLFMDSTNLSNVSTLEILVNNTFRNEIIAIVASQNSLIIENSQPTGPSIGMVVRGFAYPKEGNYPITLTAYSADGTKILQIQNVTLFFRQTKDIRFLVALMDHKGVFEPTPDWFTDISRSMLRLGSMLPVRDCVQSGLNGSKFAGLRYKVGKTCDGWVVGYYDCVYQQTEAINSGSGDDIDVTIEFRWGFYPPDYNPPGDPNPGGNSGRPPAPYGALRRASCVAGPYWGIQMTAPCFGQEIGHNFGLEPPPSPHFQDPSDPGHSKDPQLIDPFAFDFVNMRNYYPAPSGRFLGDVMNNSGAGSWQGADDVLYNAFDWEYLRQQFLGLNSTGSETHTAFSDPCGNFIIFHPTPILPVLRFYPRGDPASWIRFIEQMEKSGRNLVWNQYGIGSVDPEGRERHSVGVFGLKSILRGYSKKDIKEVYVPLDDVVGKAYSEMIGRHDDKQ